MLLESACQSIMLLTLTSPRTLNCEMPFCRISACEFERRLAAKRRRPADARTASLLAHKQPTGRPALAALSQPAAERPLDARASLAMTGRGRFIRQGRPKAVAKLAMKARAQETR